MRIEQNDDDAETEFVTDPFTKVTEHHPEFRIVEFNEPNPKTKNRFYVEVREKVLLKKLLWGFIELKKWEWRPAGDVLSEDADLGFAKFEEAKKCIEVYKRRTPTYYFPK